MPRAERWLIFPTRSEQRDRTRISLVDMSKSIVQIRNEAAAALSPERQQQWEQFLTPAPVAEQAAGLFTPAVEPVRVLDLGSGTGILAALVAAHASAGSSVTAIERDVDLAKRPKLRSGRYAMMSRSSASRCSMCCLMTGSIA